MTIAEALERFLTQLRADGRSRHTLGQYERHVRLLWVRDVRHTGAVEAMTHEDIARFLSAPQARTSAHGGAKWATSVNALRSSLKGFFSYLHRAGYIAQDPARLIRRAACGTTPPRALTEDERRRLLDTVAAADGPEARRDHALFQLMLGAGLRLSSALALDIEDLDLDAGVVTVRRAKGNRPDRVFLPGELRDHLRAYLAGRTAGPLFPTVDDRRPSLRHVQRRVARWLERAGIRRASAHSLRHAFAQDLYRRTGDLLLVKETLRHRSITSTVVYARAEDERVRAALR